jgi:hypothetical protein
MKNSKGFISVTVIYSFFLVFLTLMMFIIVNLVTNRNLLNNMKKTIKNDINDTNFANYLINRYDDLGILKVNDSYRFNGNNPNNYVKFNNEIYRIIGVIDGKVKLIKNDSITSIAFDSENSNNYSGSSVSSYLNNEFIKSLGDNATLIETSTWYIGGLDASYKTKTGAEIIKYEIGENKNNGATIIQKIGLPYISDYIYAGDEKIYNQTVQNQNNWLFTSNMWFISRQNSNLIDNYYLKSDGTIDSDNVKNLKNIKPTFYLSGSVKYISGTGTNSDPYIVG